MCGGKGLGPDPDQGGHRVRNKAITLALAASTIFTLPQLSMAQDMITGDTVGKPDAPNKIVFRMTTDGPRNNEPAYARRL